MHDEKENDQIPIFLKKEIKMNHYPSKCTHGEETQAEVLF